MSRQSKAVILYLDNSGYKILKLLGRGSFVDAIAFRNPAVREVAVNMVQGEDIWAIEDRYWPTIQHPHVMRVHDIITVQEQDVKPYMMPILSGVIDEIVESKEFRKHTDTL